jgi:hypothetical protein
LEVPVGDIFQTSFRLDYLLFKLADVEACKEAWKAAQKELQDVTFWRIIGSVSGVGSVESFTRSAEEACSFSGLHGNTVSLLLHTFEQNVNGKVFYTRPANPACGSRDAPQPAAGAFAAAGAAAAGAVPVASVLVPVAAAGGSGGQGSEGQRTRPISLSPDCLTFLQAHLQQLSVCEPGHAEEPTERPPFRRSRSRAEHADGAGDEGRAQNSS